MHPYHFIKTPAATKYISSSKESKGLYINMTCILIGSWLRTSINKINTTSEHKRLATKYATYNTQGHKHSYY